MSADLIAQNFGTYGGRVCVQLGAAQVTYARLHHVANQVAGFLVDHLSQGQQVALYFCQNQPELFEIAQGAKRGGFGYTNFYSYFSGQELLEKMKGGSYRVLFVDGKSLLTLEPVLAQIRSLGCIVVDINNSTHLADVIQYSDILKRDDSFSVPQDRRPLGLPVMLTSGTTGPSKLVPIERSEDRKSVV